MHTPSFLPACLSDAELEALIREDVPYFDLTTTALGIGAAPGRITFATRHDTVICATEEAARLLQRCGAAVEHITASGTLLPPGSTVLQASGPAQALHTAWKVAVNLLEYVSGIATRTHALVTAAQRVNPAVAVATTRKVFPGTKALSVKAVLAGGALPHRLGLSETVLVFAQHRAFTDGMPGLLQRIEHLQQTCREKKIIVEVESREEALQVARSGVDAIQFDKLPPPELAAAVQAVRQIAPGLLLAAAGGITSETIADYAGSGVDLLVTTAPYFGKPADIRATMAAI